MVQGISEKELRAAHELFKITRAILDMSEKHPEQAAAQFESLKRKARDLLKS
jgi:hypothetical protein